MSPLPLCLAVNCGSSSIKFKLFTTSNSDPSSNECVLVAGSAANVQGDSPPSFSFKHAAPSSNSFDLTEKKERTLEQSASYEQVFDEILRDVTDDAVLGNGGKSRIKVVAHRIVHGGTSTEPIVIKHGDAEEQETLDRMDEVSDFAPLHVRTQSMSSCRPALH